MAKDHYANGRECNCDMKFSASPSAYVVEHPNKRGPDGQTFNAEIDAGTKVRSR